MAFHTQGQFEAEMYVHVIFILILMSAAVPKNDVYLGEKIVYFNWTL